MKAYRNKKYLKWVKTLPCCICHTPADDSHHVIGIGHLSGMGMKAPDNYAMPLCRGCHTDMHNKPAMWPPQWEYIARVQAQWIQEHDEDNAK